MPGRLRELAPRVARLTGFLLLVVVGLQLAVARLVRAEPARPGLEPGGGRARLDAAGGRPAERVVELNGARVRLAVEASDLELAAVLDRAERGCSAVGAGALRGAGGERGVVACAVPPPAGGGAVVGEVRRAIGSHRIVYAQKGEQDTLTVSVSIDGSLDLAALFPAEGDAPGGDPFAFPRPPAARRLLSARELGASQAIAMYLASDREPAELEAWYRARLPALGWRPLDGATRAGGPRVLLVHRGERLAALVFADDAGSGGASVVILTSLDDREEEK